MSEPIGWNVYVSGQHLDGTSWHRFKEFIPNEPVLSEAASRFADEVAERASDAVEAWVAAHPRRCGAVLFPLPRDLLTDFVVWAGEPVHPDIAARCGRAQGPAPAVCRREPHPDSPWHWADGTWWR